MARKASFYIQRLEERGWDEESIRKFVKVPVPRFNRLRLIGTIPTAHEIARLRSMLRVTPPHRREAVLSVWRTQGEPSPPTEAATPEVHRPTSRQLEILVLLRRAHDAGLGGTILQRMDASIASRMQRYGYVKAEETANGGLPRKMYSITSEGLAAIPELPERIGNSVH